MSDQRIGTEMKIKLISQEKKKNTLDESFECDSLTMYLSENIILVLAAPWSKSPSGRRSTSLSLSLLLYCRQPHGQNHRWAGAASVYHLAVSRNQPQA